MGRNLCSFHGTHAVLSLVCTLALANGLFADVPPMWGNLDQGPYAVGFKTIERYDYSRTFRDKYDYLGNPLPGETARPIQICYWYPAETAEGSRGMLYGEYQFPYPEDPDFIDLLSNLQRRHLGMLFALLNNNQSAVQGAGDFALLAVRDAAPQQGSFPLIVYHAEARGVYCENVIMCEYLASHGFIVATTHSLGTTSTNPSGSPADVETCLRDKEFVAAIMRDVLGVNTDKLGLAGFHTGGSAALIHRMRNTGVDAVATLQSAPFQTDQVEIMSQNPYFNTLRVTAPLMFLRADGSGTEDHAIIDSLKYADRLLLKFSDLQATGLTSYSAISALAPDSVDPSLGVAREKYEIACRYVLNFFKANLYADEAGRTFVKNSPADNGIDSTLLAVSFIVGKEAPPTAEQFVSLVQEYGTDRAAEVCEKFNLASPDNPILPGPTFTGLGYQFLQRGNAADAIVLFKMGVQAYPGSANAWDSYGEACVAIGDNKLALENYRKALEILPQDSTINPGLRDAIGNNAPATIERLEQLIAEEASSDQRE